MLLMLSAHPSRRSDLLTEDRMHFSPHVKARNYNDAFGNICTRLVAPPGLLEIRNDLIIADSGLPDEVAPDAEQWPIDALPDDALVYLLGSRYCDTQKLSEFAWSMFGRIRGGWARAQAICQYVHDRIQFGYHYARDDRTAAEGHEERIGVCRDFAHLAIALGRCMNIPARKTRCWLRHLPQFDRRLAAGRIDQCEHLRLSRPSTTTDHAPHRRSSSSFLDDLALWHCSVLIGPGERDESMGQLNANAAASSRPNEDQNNFYAHNPPNCRHFTASLTY